ncbi:hypothetical protein [Actinoplanes sp. NPDC049265]|uniref:hypothetical protein n=1 Tax=Actinoplanes sp. NPDC049265 TaxID=3363902 RepID=UPI003718B26C
MTENWRHLPAPARPIAAATVEAVTAVRARDAAALDQASAELGALDAAQTGLILGTTVRLLLERAHPDGVDGDDVRAVLERCARTSMTWLPGVDPHVLLILLAGALGVLDEDDTAARPPAESLAQHAALLLADLSTGDPAPHLTAALAEIERAQLND